MGAEAFWEVEGRERRAFALTSELRRFEEWPFRPTTYGNRFNEPA